MVLIETTGWDTIRIFDRYLSQTRQVTVFATAQRDRGPSKSGYSTPIHFQSVPESNSTTRYPTTLRGMSTRMNGFNPIPYANMLCGAEIGKIKPGPDVEDRAVAKVNPGWLRMLHTDTMAFVAKSGMFDSPHGFKVIADSQDAAPEISSKVPNEMPIGKTTSVPPIHHIFRLFPVQHTDLENKHECDAGHRNGG